MTESPTQRCQMFYCHRILLSHSRSEMYWTNYLLHSL